MSAGRRRGRDDKHRLEAYLGRLYGYAFSLARDREEARAVVQEAAIKALAAGAVPVDEPAYRAWLFRIVRNAFIDRLRRQRRSERFEPLLDGTADLAAPAEYIAGDERLITIVTVRMGFACLAPAQREVIGLVDIAGLSYNEAAEALGIPRGTVMSRLSRARKALIEAIEADNVRPLRRRKTR